MNRFSRWLVSAGFVACAANAPAQNVLDSSEFYPGEKALYEAVLARPAAAFERLEAVAGVSASDLRRSARRYFVPARTVVLVRPQPRSQKEEAAE